MAQGSVTCHRLQSVGAVTRIPRHARLRHARLRHARLRHARLRHALRSA
ncbi:pentapeptide repeat-containing protein [Paraburkholderia haematera]